MGEANTIVLKSSKIIDYFTPKYWFIENPQTGLLKKHDFMKDLPILMLIIASMICFTGKSEMGYRKSMLHGSIGFAE